MKVLIFDTETTGLPTERNPSIYETQKWPHVIQLSYIVYDSETNDIITVEDDYIHISDDVPRDRWLEAAKAGVSSASRPAQGNPLWTGTTHVAPGNARDADLQIPDTGLPPQRQTRQCRRRRGWSEQIGNPSRSVARRHR